MMANPPEIFELAYPAVAIGDAVGLILNPAIQPTAPLLSLTNTVVAAPVEGATAIPPDGVNRGKGMIEMTATVGVLVGVFVGV